MPNNVLKKEFFCATIITVNNQAQKGEIVVKRIDWKSISLFTLTIAMTLGACVQFLFSAGAASAAGNGSVLYGRSALFIGDSITYGSRDSATYKSWAGRIGQKNKMEYINAGVGGTSISSCRATKQGRIIEQLNKYEGKSFDYVIMHGGVNDAWDMAAVGSVSEGFDSSGFDVSSFAGGLEETFARAKELFPDAVYGFIMNNALPKCPYGNISDMSAYMAVAKQVCEKWGVSYLDLYNDLEFCYNVLRVDTSDYFGDDYYCHPNAAGYDLIAPVVEEWMESLPRPNYPTEEESTSETADEDPFEEEPITKESNTLAEEHTQTTEEATNEGFFLPGCASAVHSVIAPIVIFAIATVALFLKKRNKA